MVQIPKLPRRKFRLNRFCNALTIRCLLEVIYWQARLRTRSGRFLLCINRELANRDSVELAISQRQLRVVTIPGWALHSVAARQIPPNLRHANHVERAWPIQFEEAATFLSRLAKRLKKRGCVGLLLANINYWNDQPLRIALQREELKTFVLMKEAVLSQLHEEMWRSDNFPAISSEGISRIFVANADTATAMLANRSARPDQLVITGLPRFDYLSRENFAIGTPSSSALFLSYGSLLEGKFSRENEEALRIFLEVTTACEVTATVKLKDSLEMTRRQATHYQDFGSKVKILVTSPLSPLIQSSVLIVGGPSLSTVEALMQGKTVIFPAWGTLADPKTHLLQDSRFIGRLLLAEDRDHFRRLLHDQLLRTDLEEGTSAWHASRWSANPADGSSIRIFREIESELAGRT